MSSVVIRGTMYPMSWVLSISIGLVISSHVSILTGQSRIDEMDPLSKMFMFPQSKQFASPSDVGLEGEDVTFANASGHMLHGWYLKAKDARQTIMICPGNAGNISIFLPYANLFNEGGFNVFLFDYQGYGKSEGVPSFWSLQGDVTAAYQYATETLGIKVEDLGVFGVSLGSTMSIFLAARHPIGALAVEDVFVPGDMLEKYKDQIGDSKLVQFTLATVRKNLLPIMDPLENIPKVKAPLFLLHGELDTFLPPASSFRVRDAAAGPTRIWIMKGVGHAPESLEVNDREFAWQLNRFFKEAFEREVEGEFARLDPKIKFDSLKKDGQFETTIKIETNHPAALEIGLMDQDSQVLTVRKQCEKELTFTVTTRFKPEFVSAVDCEYHKPGSGGHWEPVFSKMSQDRLDAINFRMNAARKVGQFWKEANDSKVFNSLKTWNVAVEDAPDPADVHPHIRPYYAQSLASYANRIRDPDESNLVPMWQVLDSYVPERPEEFYRLGNAWFRLGFRNTDVVAIYYKWAKYELSSGNTKSAQEKLRRMVQVTRLSGKAWQDKAMNVDSIEELDNFVKEHSNAQFANRKR